MAGHAQHAEGHKAPVQRWDALVVGGGIAGLTAAWDLVRAGLRPLLIEARGYTGGLVAAGPIAGVRMDLGAEGFVVRGQAATSMLAELGAKNLADENPSLLKDFSLESIIEMNPDFIFVVPMGNDDAAAMKALEDQTAANPAWSTLDAVQNGRYVTLDPHLFQYKPNERWDESYQVLFDALYA